MCVVVAGACAQKRTSTVGTSAAPAASEVRTTVTDAAVDPDGARPQRIPRREAIPAPAGMIAFRDETALVAGRHEISVGPFDRDTCVRVGIDASARLAVELAEVGAPFAGAAVDLGDSPALVPTEGPMCFARGRTARVTLGGQARAIFVVWTSAR